MGAALGRCLCNCRSYKQRAGEDSNEGERHLVNEEVEHTATTADAAGTTNTFVRQNKSQLATELPTTSLLNRLLCMSRQYQSDDSSSEGEIGSLEDDKSVTSDPYFLFVPTQVLSNEKCVTRQQQIAHYDKS